MPSDKSTYPKDNDIVVYFNKKYYLLREEKWKAAPQLAGEPAGPAKTLINAGGTVGYRKDRGGAPGSGGYSCIIDFGAVRKGKT